MPGVLVQSGLAQVKDQIDKVFLLLFVHKKKTLSQGFFFEKKNQKTFGPRWFGGQYAWNPSGGEKR